MRYFWEGESLAGWHEPPQLLYDNELVAVSRGAFHLQLKGETQAMEVGSVAIVPPGTWHQSWVAKGGGAMRHTPVQSVTDWPGRRAEVAAAAADVCYGVPPSPASLAVELLDRAEM